MAGNTTNFNIAYPTSTDYVKDGATAIQTVATGFDARLGDITNYPSQIVNVVSGVSRPLPYAMSTGRYTQSGSAVASGSSVTATIAFTRSTRFNNGPPVITLTQTGLPGGSAGIVVKLTNAATTGFTAYMVNLSSATQSWTAAQVDFIAVQMTSANAENS